LFIFSAKANAVAAALSSSNANDPNVTKAVKEFKKAVTDKVGNNEMTREHSDHWIVTGWN
jgi:hypothetical protein